ncbi:MAG: histidine kinase [Saprospiraceae bacterium]|nr:histidine kinase [Saprospiraceae bacterium]
MRVLVKIIIISCCQFYNVIGQITNIDTKTELKHQIGNFQPDIIFDNVTEKDGLSSYLVSSMVLDHDGFLWIGTHSGLNRYDGKRFEVFRRKKGDPTTLLQNAIRSLDVDLQGNIWCGTEDGISCYVKATKKFKSFVFDDKELYPRANELKCDQDGIIWAGSENGLVRLDPITGKFTYFRYDVSDINSLPDNRIDKNGIIYDIEKKGLWLATKNGLCFFDIKTNKVINHRNTKNNPIYLNHSVSALHKSKEGIIWYFDNNTQDIIGFNPKTEQVLHSISLRGKLKDPYAGFIFETSYHHLWFSSISYETIRIDYLNGNKMEIIKHDETNSTSILGDFVSSAFEDKDQTVWLGTYAGLSRFNHKRLFFSTKKVSKQFPEFNINWYITCLTQNPKTEEWWVGTRDDKAYIYNPTKDTWTKVDFSGFSKESNAKFITDIEFVDDIAVIFYASAMTYQYDTRNGKFSKFYGLTGSFSDYKTRSMVQETDSTYILGNNLPVLRWNKNTNKLQTIRLNKTKDEKGNVYGAGWFTSKKNQGVWMSVSNQDVGYLHPGDSIIYIFKLPIGFNVHQGGYFNGISVDDFGQPWISYTTQGLLHLKKKKEKIETQEDVELKSWTVSEGLVNETLYSTTTDHKGQIWCSSLNKFSVFDVKKNQFYNFKIHLSENNSFYFNYMTLLKNGNVITNIRGDIIEFNPAFLNVLLPENPVIISSLSLPDRKILLGGEPEIKLEPDENFITFGFGSLSVSAYTSYHFEYILDGVNDKWVTADGESEAPYTNLPPGKYTFQLRAISQDGAWKSDIKTLKIIIKTPFYKSWWFLSIIGILTAYIMFYTARARIRNIRNIDELKSKAQLLEKEKTAVMYENLKQHLNPHFLFNSLTSLSSLIRIDQRQAGDFLDKMSKVYRYILKNKENETVPLFEELKFVEMYNQLQKTRFGDGIQIKIDIPEEYHYRKIAPVTLQNLVENAIKHNIADEESPLIIRMYIEDDFLIVQNNLQTKGFVETSNKQGQNRMVSLYRYLSPRPVVITESEDFYTVKIPLI